MQIKQFNFGRKSLMHAGKTLSIKYFMFGGTEKRKFYCYCVVIGLACRLSIDQRFINKQELLVEHKRRNLN